jgi:hypothetical protein
MQACMKYISDPTKNSNNAYSAKFEECIKKATLKQTDKIKKQECKDIEDIETVQQVMDMKQIKNGLVASKYIFANQRYLAIHSYLNAVEAEKIKNLAIQQWIEREWAKENLELPSPDMISKQKRVIKKNPIIEQLALVEYYKEQEKLKGKVKGKNSEDVAESIERIRRGR